MNATDTQVGEGSGATTYPEAPEILARPPGEGLELLVGPETAARIAELAGPLSIPAQTVCYECRLAEGDPRVDLALCVFNDFGGGLTRQLKAYRPRAGEAAWRRALEFLGNWASLASPVAAEVPFVWVAFDFEGREAVLPVPCLGLCVDRDFFARRLGLSPPAPSTSDVLDVAARCHQDLYTEALPEPARRLIQLCLDGYDYTVEARHLSFMLSRQPATFKLDVRLPVSSLGPFLRRIDWPGPADRIEAGVRRFMPWQGAVQLNLVLSPALANPLEVELLTEAGAIPEGGRSHLLDTLVAEGLCGPAKAAGLRAIAETPAIIDRDGARVARAWYVKVRFLEDRPAEAKAYVGLMPRPVPGSSRWFSTHAAQ